MADAPTINVSDPQGLSFACQSGCGFCCTATPLVLPHEAPALGKLVVKAEDGSLRIPIKGLSCGSLQADKSCGNYVDRPSVCHLYPFQVHAGRRIQVTLTLGCPGVAGAGYDARQDAPPTTTGDISAGANEAARIALAQPGAAAMAARAKETFAEFDRRMKEWGVHTTPDRLRAGFLPHLPLLARPEALPAFFTGLEAGDLVLDGKPARAVETLFAAETQFHIEDLLLEAARDAFDNPDDVVWVETTDYAWTTVRADGARLHVHRQKDGVDREPFTVDPGSIPTDWHEDAIHVLGDYLERLAHRDQTEGAAAWLVDASGYQVTPAAAFGRVLGEASLQVILRAGIFAAESGAPIDAALARRAVAAYETTYHSLPTLGSVL